jgi:hypothetical protein
MAPASGAGTAQVLHREVSGIDYMGLDPVMASDIRESMRGKKAQGVQIILDNDGGMYVIPDGDADLTPLLDFLRKNGVEVVAEVMELCG